MDEDKDLEEAAAAGAGGEEDSGAKDEEKASEQEAGQGEGEKEEDFSKIDPEVRKSPTDYFQEREEERRAKRPSAKDGEEEDEELNEAAQRALAREVESTVRKVLDPFRKEFSATANSREVSDFLGRGENNSRFAKFAPLVRKMMDAYKGITAENAFLLAEAKYGNLAERGAEAERRRQAEGGRRRMSARSERPVKRGPGAEEISAEEVRQMTPEQFKQFDERIKEGAKVKGE